MAEVNRFLNPLPGNLVTEVHVNTLTELEAINTATQYTNNSQADFFYSHKVSKIKIWPVMDQKTCCRSHVVNLMKPGCASFTSIFSF